MYLVGAGPGDPDLLTLRAARELANADVVVHDALVGDGVLALIPAGVERIDVGKRPGRATPQEMISAMLVHLARQGRRVVRLKGGDPFVFGRGGEEIDTLFAQGVRFEVVPGITVQVINGITAGLAGITSLGAPLTHREHAHGVLFITGHVRPGDSDTDWRAIAATARDARLTLVIYMGVRGSAHIQEELLTGLPASTPVAVIQHVSLPDQRHALTTLGQLHATIERDQLTSPCVIVVGDVVRGVAAARAPEALRRIA